MSVRDGPVLISGYYGFGNAGDEAILSATASMLAGAARGHKLVVISGNPRATRALHQLSAVPRGGPELLAPLRRAALFLSGGGSLLQDRTSVRSLFYYTGMLWVAQLLGVPTMVFAQGVGPLSRPMARRWTARVLRRCRAITVRDAESAQLLGLLGVGHPSGPEVEVTADPVFALAPQVTERVMAAAPPAPSVAVALRHWPGVEALLDPLSEALGYIHGEAAIQAWALHREQDLPLAEALAARLPDVVVQREPFAPGEWLALAGWTSAVVGMRLHALIFAAARGVPVYGISYDPKVDALLERVRGRGAGSVSSPPDPAELGGALRTALETDAAAEARRRDRELRSEHLRVLALRNAEKAAALLH